MKKIIILLLAAILSMNFMCSGASLDCTTREVYNDYVAAGSFTYRYETELYDDDYFKIKIITDGKKTEKIIEPEQTKRIIVDGKEMWETSPVFITDSSNVIVYRVDCEYVY